MDDLQKAAIEVLTMNKQSIVFAPSRASAEKSAEDLSKFTSINTPELAVESLKGITPTKQCNRLAKCLKKGVAFHHAGLRKEQRELIEKEFRDGKIKIVCATPTLAMGINMPAYRIIIKSLKRYSGRWGMDWIPVLEYLQMAGRAGRPQYESFGEAIIIAKSAGEKEEIFNKYVCGFPEDIYSKLAVEPVLRTYLLSLISSGIIKDQKSMLDFFSKTFWAYQFKDMQKLESIMHRMVSLLKDWEFVKILNHSSDFTTANNINDQKYFATNIGKRISELYIDPLTARHLLDCINKFKNNSLFSLLHMISYTLEMRPLLTVRAKEQEYIHDELFSKYDYFLVDEPSSYTPEYNDFLNSIKTALFLNEWINEKDEEYLLDKFTIRPGEIRSKLEIGDWLLYATEELSKIEQNNLASREIAKLRIRLKHGVKEDLLPLLRLKNIGRVRARKLVNNGIFGIKELKSSSLTTLQQILGRSLAVDIKRQIGQEIKEVPKKKRVGQLSLEKY